MAFFNYSSGNASSFWLGNDFEIKNADNKVDYTKLAATQRAIANFVNIVTGKQIPVEFQGVNSYTDGESVVIGTDFEGANFDPSVGLALHEGSHIAHTNFKLLRNFRKAVSMQGADPDFDMTYEQEALIKDLFNWIEDRRIDYLIYKTAPGYRMYYESMYEKYFNDRAIDKALREGRKHEETLDDYLFHIINFTNPNRNLQQLEMLQEIWDLIDLRNIDRLKNSQDALVVACDIYKKLKSHLAAQPQDQNQKQQQCQGSCSGGDDEEVDSESQPSDGEEQDDNNNATPSPSPLSDRQKKILDNAINKQRKFLNGDQKKKGKLNKKQSYTVKAIQEAGSEIVPVDLGNDIHECVVIKKLTPNIIEHMDYLFVTTRRCTERNQVWVNKGIQLGKILGRKLQVRNEERSLKSTRLTTGKIDRRLISQLGYDNTNVFHRIVTDRYKDYFIHISIDASGSMGGEKFEQAMTSAIAIAQAASMTTGIRVQISLRGTTSQINENRDQCITLIAYDSKTDKIGKIKRLFKHLSTFGMTPEGVAFRSIEKQLLVDGNGCEKVFINYSDGYPTYMGYYATDPKTFTKQSINRFREAGISILSYFITTGYGSIEPFKYMYGQDAENIDPKNMMQVARTMNSKFLEKSK
jgi:hypothetical protein